MPASGTGSPERCSSVTGRHMLCRVDMVESMSVTGGFGGKEASSFYGRGYFVFRKGREECTDRLTTA